MKEHNVKPEMECFDVGHTNSTAVLAEMACSRRRSTSRSSWACSAGFPRPRATSRSRPSRFGRLAVEGDSASAASSGSSRWRRCHSAVMFASASRTTSICRNGELAKSNGELVAAAGRDGEDVGRSVATVDEAKLLLWPTAVATELRWHFPASTALSGASSPRDRARADRGHRGRTAPERRADGRHEAR